MPSLKQMRFWKGNQMLSSIPVFARMTDKIHCFQSLVQLPNTILVRRSLGRLSVLQEKPFAIDG